MTTRRLMLRLAVAAALLGAVGPATPQTLGAAPRTWRLVALGDSIPYGGRYCAPCTPYPSLLATALSRQSGHPVAVTNLAIPGLTTTQLLANVRGRAKTRAAIAAGDIVTVTIGHNDTPWNSLHDSCDGAHAFFEPYRDAQWASYTGVCLTQEADALRVRLGSILATIHSLRAGRATLIEVTTDWNQVIGKADVTALARRASKAVLDRFRLVTCSAARANAARCGDVYHLFNGSDGTRTAGALLAADHDHASRKGHEIIAAALARFGFAPLVR